MLSNAFFSEVGSTYRDLCLPLTLVHDRYNTDAQTGKRVSKFFMICSITDDGINGDDKSFQVLK